MRHGIGEVARALGRYSAPLALAGLLGTSCRDFDNQAVSTPSSSGAGSGGSKTGNGGSVDDAGAPGHPDEGSAGSDANHPGGQGGAPGEQDTGGMGGEPSEEGGRDSGGAGAGALGGDGGAGALGGEGGVGGALDDSVDEVINPYCYEPGTHPGIGSFVPASDISVFRSYGGLHQLVATQPSNDVIVTTWQNSTDPDSSWVWWGCFNLVPSPDRIAGTTLGNGLAAVFASSVDGVLWSRYMFPGASSPSWGPWLPIKSPPGSGKIFDLDAVAAPEDLNRLYAARDGHLFVRHAETLKPYATLLSWRTIADQEIEEVAACRIGNGRDRLFITNTAHELLSTEWDVTNTSPPNWVKLADQAFETVDCVRDAQGKLQVFAGNSSDEVWRSTEPFEDWEIAAVAPAPILTIDAAAIPDSDPLLIVLDVDGDLHLWRSAAGGWYL